MERTLHPWTKFLTLTYSDESISSGSASNTYDDMQLFLKRYRKTTGEPIRYFLAGELGPQNDRLHWHVVLFGCRNWKEIERGDPRYPYKQSATWHHPNNRLLTKLWPHGFITVGGFSPKRARYTSKYTMKEADAIVRASLKPGLGAGFVPTLVKALKEANHERCPFTINIGRKSYPIHPYIRGMVDTALNYEHVSTENKLVTGHLKALGLMAFGDPLGASRKAHDQLSQMERKKLHGSREIQRKVAANADNY